MCQVVAPSSAPLCYLRLTALAPIALFFFAGLALVIGSVSAFRQRLLGTETPKPSIPNRRWIVAAITLVGAAAHLLSWLKVRTTVPVGAKPGSLILGGPGDGFVLLFIILAPWLFMQFINVGLAFYCSRTWKQASFAGSLLLAVWIGALASGAQLASCPEGFTCSGG